MADKTSSTEVTQQKKVFVKSEAVLKEMEANGQLEPFTDYYTPEANENMYFPNKVLWVNPSPSNSFSAQTIELAEYDYDYLLVMYSYIRGNTLKSTIVDAGSTAYLDCSWGNVSAKNVNTWRTITYVDKTHLSVSDCSAIYPSSSSTYINNEFCTPYKIVGMKLAPNMIYTGAELKAGNGIDIEDGEISATKWKTFNGTAGSENYLPINWNELSEICFRVLGSDQATFGYVHIPKELWHNDGAYILEVNCFNEYGTFKGAMWFEVIGKHETSTQIKATVKNSAQSGFTIAYR